MKNKTIISGVILVLAGLFIWACSLMEDEVKPAETVAKVGNSWTAKSTDYPSAKLDVIQNDKGIVNAQISYNGQNYNVKGKVSTEEISDFVYSNGDESKPFILARFDAKPGDTYEYNIGNQKVVRTVLANPEEVTSWALGLIVKCVVVEEVVPAGVQILGKTAKVKKIKWYLNHRFGFIAAEVTDVNGKVSYVNLQTTNCDTSNQ
ncbi:MAG: hypothetical protein U0Y10_09005 [Spirosomataceae bacterium]